MTVSTLKLKITLLNNVKQTSKTSYTTADSSNISPLQAVQLVFADKTFLHTLTHTYNHHLFTNAHTDKGVSTYPPPHESGETAV